MIDEKLRAPAVMARTSPLSPALSPEYRGEGVRWWTVLVVFASILQFCLFLNHRDITTSHEGRVAATAREMRQRGEWIVPYCNDVPRLAKPPLAYWAAIAAWDICGAKDQPWPARLPGA